MKRSGAEHLRYDTRFQHQILDFYFVFEHYHHVANHNNNANHGVQLN